MSFRTALAVRNLQFCRPYGTLSVLYSFPRARALGYFHSAATPVSRLAEDRGPTTENALNDYKLLNIYRSISPSTMSILPIAATTSAISRPSHIFGSVCMFAKHADRMCTRYGFGPPSLTT